jgi:hypothetical protein
MTTEKHDPWALLAEIHELQPWLSQDADLAARVDAALAERAEGPTEDKVDYRLVHVEWRLVRKDEDVEIHEAYPDEHTALDVVQFKAAKWRWTLSHEEQGYCDTREEAKSAAIAAARGMR